MVPHLMRSRCLSTLFIVCLAFQLPLTIAQSSTTDTTLPASTGEVLDSSDDLQDAATNFTAAALLEALNSHAMRHGNWSDQVPLPQNGSSSEPLLHLASLMPPQLNGGAVNLDAQAIIDQITPPPNATEAEERDDRRDDGLLRSRAASLRVLVVGDSMTHSNQGDYTWRYRIWQWFNSQNIPITFVGPYVGTIAPDPPSPPQPPTPSGQPIVYAQANTNGGYAADVDPNFNPRHFAISGRAAATDKGLIQNVVANNPADLMLVMLGFNDLAWFYSDDNGLISNMKALIDNARASNPNIKVVVATVPQRTFVPGRDDLVKMTDNYNSMLKQATPGWSTSASPVTWAPVREEYDCGPQYGQAGYYNCPAAFDGLHPNEVGEYQIARGFSRGLVSGLGIGSSPLVVPSSIPARPLPPPTNIAYGTSAQGVTATWDAVYGAYSYDVDYLINSGSPWNFSPGNVRSNRWDSRWALDGWNYRIRIRSVAGNRYGDWSGYYTATAHPQLPNGAFTVSVSPTATGIDVSWSQPGGQYSSDIFIYLVYFYDQNQCGFLEGYGFQGTSAHIDGLIPGDDHLVFVEPWTHTGPGLPSVARNVITGRGTPGQVQNVQIVAKDGGTSHITWDAVPGASNYIFWRRNSSEPGSTLQRVLPEYGQVTTCIDFYYQAGTWFWEWAVTAVNGALEGPRSNPVQAPYPVNGQSVPACPAAPPTCTGGGSGGIPNTAPIDPNSPPGAGEGGQPVPISAGGTTTTTTAGAGSTTRSSAAALPPASSSYPVVTNGQCKGPDCQNGQCVGLLCVSFGCSGSDCHSGVCSGLNCVTSGCIGPNCKDGMCTTSGCTVRGCAGPQCGSNGLCTGLNCISVGCIGSDCDASSGLCKGSSCSEGWCHGLNCGNGVCQSSCSDNGVAPGGSGPTVAPTVAPPPASPTSPTTTTTTTCTSQTTASTCAVTCQVIIGDEPHTTSCGSTSCSSTTTGCNVRGRVTSVLSTWVCPSAAAIATTT